jgi:ribosomal protein S18 acetylase RimI-like enzyme
MLYRLYRAEDFPQLYAIERECFQPPFRFPRRYMQQLIASPDSATWIAEEDHQMTAFAIVEWTSESENITAYIQTLEVASAHRHRGIATELLRRLETSATTAGATAIGLHVAESNAPAIHLYHAHGYLSQGREETYYAQGIAALIYFKPLN